MIWFLDLRTLSPNPLRRDKPAQRFQVSGFRSAVSGQRIMYLSGQEISGDFNINVKI